MSTVKIDCDTCAMQATDACAGCLVSVICGPVPQGGVVIDVAEARAVRLLGRGGLVPPLRHRPRVACA